MPKIPEKEIRVDVTVWHQTWHQCPRCKRCWKDDKPTPGVLHSDKLCDFCKGENPKSRT